MRGGHKVNTKQSLLVFIFSHLLTDQDKIWYGVKAI